MTWRDYDCACGWNEITEKYYRKCPKCRRKFQAGTRTITYHNENLDDYVPEANKRYEEAKKKLNGVYQKQ